jgi:hypothetical protein
MKEILVTIFVLSLQEEYDLFIPISLNLNLALDLIQNSLVELSDGNYVKVEKPMLFSMEGLIINNNNTVKYSGLKNGCTVILK